MDTVGTTMESKRYKCEICMKQFDIYSTFYSHKRTHSSESLPCKACTQTFPTKLKRFQHYYNSHGDNKPVQQLLNVDVPSVVRRSTLSTRMFE